MNRDYAEGVAEGLRAGQAGIEDAFTADPGELWMPEHSHLPHPVVYVEWLDSSGMGDWADPQHYESLQPSRCVTAGFVLSDTPEHLTVVQSRATTPGHEPERQYDHAICIPTQAITRRADVPMDMPLRHVTGMGTCPACEEHL